MQLQLGESCSGGRSIDGELRRGISTVARPALPSASRDKNTAANDGRTLGKAHSRVTHEHHNGVAGAGLRLGGQGEGELSVLEQEAFAQSGVCRGTSTASALCVSVPKSEATHQLQERTGLVPRCSDMSPSSR